MLLQGKYKARGSNNTWDWLRLISPCTQSLRDLQNNFNNALGSDMGKKHASARLVEDIRSLMVSLKEHNVYVLQPGRATADDDPPVPDVQSAGLAQLTCVPNSPLTDFNTALKRLQARRRMRPIGKAPSPALNFTEIGPHIPLSAGASLPDPPSLSPSPPPEAVPAGAPPTAATDAPLTTDPPPASAPTMAELTDEIAELQEDDYDDTTEEVIEGELRRVVEGMEEDTLPRVSMRDVALDMDEPDTDEESDIDSASDDSDSDYED